MGITLVVSLAVSCVSLATWLYLVAGRGAFWRTRPRLEMGGNRSGKSWPAVAVIVPARNEASTLPETLPTLLAQDYPGGFHIYLVDDQSGDGTGELAARIARECGAKARLTVVSGQELPQGWAGKVWALEQGVQAATPKDASPAADHLWFTDADISHAPGVLAALMSQALSSKSAIVSVMADLRRHGFWESLLVPAFAFYFAKLYPFRWVNDPTKPMAAAAGGCVLLDRESLESAGGLDRISGAIIDDCALARLIKNQGPERSRNIWLGYCHGVRSVRSYEGLPGVWSMVARTAYTQLRYSPSLLAGTVIAMTLVYLVPPAAALGGIAAALSTGEAVLASSLLAVGWAAWALLAWSFQPMLRWYRASPWWGLLLPLAGLLYTMMTIESARRHLRVGGGSWKGRTISPSHHTNLPGSPDQPHL